MLDLYFLDYGYPSSISEHLIRFLLLAVASSFLYFIIQVVLTKSMAGGKKIHKEYQIRLAVLYAYVVFIMLFSIFFFFVLKRNGLEIFAIRNTSDVLIVSPLILIYLLAILLFSIRYRQYVNYVKA